jgi:hypothetical protein
LTCRPGFYGSQANISLFYDRFIMWNYLRGSKYKSGTYQGEPTKYDRKNALQNLINSNGAE